MTDFTRLDRADSWLAVVTSSIRRRVMTAGHARWNSPGNSRTRERAARLSQRAHVRREAEVARLVRAAPASVGEGVARTRLRDRAEDRMTGKLARYRDPSPSGRAPR